MKKFVSTFVLLFILCSVLVCFPKINIAKAEAKTIIVPDDYTTIQQAIGNAENGDTILVRSGTYEGIQNQTLTINKTISLIGEDAENTKIHLHPPLLTETIFTQTFSYRANSIVIDANNVIISGFTITSDGGEIRANGNTTQILGNVISTHLSLWGYNQTFALNTVTATLRCRGYYSSVYKNNFVNCSIASYSGAYASIFNNTVLGGGIGSNVYELIYGNIVKNGNGISLACSGSVVAFNTVTDCVYGVAILWGGMNNVSGNLITNCQIGLYKTEKHGGNIFYANYVANNSYGVKIAYGAPSSETTLYHNNFVNNVQQVNTDPTKTTGGSSSVPELTRPLIHTGLFDNGTEGNFWSDYIGTDINQDNIGDIPYFIDEKRADNHPLMSPVNISSVIIQLPEWANIEPLNIVPTPQQPKSQPSNPFLTWVVTAVVIVTIAVIGAALLVYFIKIRKTTGKVEK